MGHIGPHTGAVGGMAERSLPDIDTLKWPRPHLPRLNARVTARPVAFPLSRAAWSWIYPGPPRRGWLPVHTPILLSQDGFTPVYMAAQSGHTEACKFLVASGADVNKAEVVPRRVEAWPLRARSRRGPRCSGGLVRHTDT